MATPVHEVDLQRELLLLDELLAETRRRFRQRKTQLASAQKLMDVDLEIRSTLASPPSPELLLDVRRLTARLRALDPH